MAFTAKINFGSFSIRRILHHLPSSLDRSKPARFVMPQSLANASPTMNTATVTWTRRTYREGHRHVWASREAAPSPSLMELLRCRKESVCRAHGTTHWKMRVRASTIKSHRWAEAPISSNSLRLLTVSLRRRPLMSLIMSKSVCHSSLRYRQILSCRRRIMNKIAKSSEARPKRRSDLENAVHTSKWLLRSARKNIALTT